MVRNMGKFTLSALLSEASDLARNTAKEWVRNPPGCVVCDMILALLLTLMIVEGPSESVWRVLFVIGAGAFLAYKNALRAERAYSRVRAERQAVSQKQLPMRRS